MSLADASASPKVRMQLAYSCAEHVTGLKKSWHDRKLHRSILLPDMAEFGHKAGMVPRTCRLVRSLTDLENVGGPMLG